MRNFQKSLIFFSFLSMLFLASCAALDDGSAQSTASGELPPDIGTISIGYIPSLGYAPFFVADQKGYFEEQGLDVALESFRGGSAMLAPLSTGQLDIGGGGAGPGLLNAVNQGLDIKVVGSLASQPEGYGAVPLLVRSDLMESGEVSGPADLAGRKVAVNIERDMAEYLLAKALEQGDLSIDDIELVALPFPEMQQAFANEAIEAAILPHPLASRAIGEGDAQVLIDGDEITDWPQNGLLYFGQRMLKPENKEAAVRFLVAYLEASRDLQGDGWQEEDNVAAINAITNVPVPAIRNGVAYYFEPNAWINRDSVADFQAYQFDRGYTDLTEMLPLDQMIIDSYLEEALSRMGEVEPIIHTLR